MSNVDSFESTNFEGYLSSIYGGLIVHRIKVNGYLIMDPEDSKQVTVKLSMIKYINSVLQEFPENFGKTTDTPLAKHLLTVCDES